MEKCSRREAIAIGGTRYFTGKPCKHGHISERLTKSRHSVSCGREHSAKHFAKRSASDPEFVKRHRQRAAEWKRLNPDKKRAQMAKWRKANPDKISGYNKRWRLNNPEKAKENSKRSRLNRGTEKQRIYFKRWETRNPERAAAVKRASKVNRRAREAQNGGRASGKDIERLFKLQKGRCAECKKRRKLTIDHIQAIANGGSGDPPNLQLLCFPCNRRKSDKDAIVWAREHGRLL